MGLSVVRGTGKQRIGAFITSTAYWLFGIPLSYLCAFKLDYGIRGLWYGPTFAVTYNTFWYNILIARIDWQELIAQTQERRNKEKAVKAKLDKE